jgi:broad specificity phosphatase PhoE
VPIVLLIRHAQASFGATDYDVLSELGLEQVDALERGLARRGIVADHVVTGSLRRQQDTARPWAEVAERRPKVDPRWNEYDDHDVLSHHSTSSARVDRRSADAPAVSSREFQVIADEALQRWVDAGSASTCKQTWPQFLADVRGAFDDVVRELRSGQTALVFSSSGVISAIVTSLIGVPDQALVAVNRVSVNTGITKIVVGRQGRSLVSYNEHCHLEEAAGELVTYR